MAIIKRDRPTLKANSTIKVIMSAPKKPCKRAVSTKMEKKSQVEILTKMATMLCTLIIRSLGTIKMEKKWKMDYMIKMEGIRAKISRGNQGDSTPKDTPILKDSTTTKEIM